MPDRLALTAGGWLTAIPRPIRSVLSPIFGVTLFYGAWDGGWWGVASLVAVLALLFLVLALAEELEKEARRG